MVSSIVQGNSMHIPLRDRSVQMCVTSPPYYGLRSYSVGGERGEVGKDQSVEEYVANIVEVFREVRRVLRDDGVVFLNLGDSYAGSGGAHTNGNSPGISRSYYRGGVVRQGGNERGMKLKPKDLIGIPWLVAFALRADGWWLRSDIIWHKPNAMPESARDRPTRDHEYLFLLSKSQDYYYDGDAIREPMREATAQRDRYAFKRAFKGQFRGSPVDDRYQEGKPIEESRFYDPAGRNKRTVWSIMTQSTSFAHFATFPERLVEPCIRAGSSEYGACSCCSAPYRRIVIRTPESYNPDEARNRIAATGGLIQGGTERCTLGRRVRRETKGWQPTCKCEAPIKRSIVLDPFSGTGTVGLVCQKLGRDYIGIDLSIDYNQVARARLGLTALAEWERGRKVEEVLDLGPLFQSETVDSVEG